jgi:hypothetical protein
MNTSIFEPLALHVKFDTDTMWVEFSDGRQLGVPHAYFPRLLNASHTECEKYTISGGGKGLHWDTLDEDIWLRASC